MTHIARVLATFGAVLLAVTPVLGQGNSSVTGSVEDPLGAGIPAAQVTLSNKPTGKNRGAVTDADGQFRFNEVLPGDYVLTAEAEYFQTARLPITVKSDPQPPLKLKLSVTIEEEVTVTAARAPSRVSPETNAAAMDVDDDLLRGLPSQGQDILGLVGAFTAPAGTGGLSIIVDGAETDQVNLPASAIRRLFVNRNPYAVDYRRPGKARIEVVTESGSRRAFHGETSAYVRDASLDARNAFAREKPDVTRRVGQFSFGGPLPGKTASFFLSGDRKAIDDWALVNAQTLGGPIVENVATPDRRTNALGRLDLSMSSLHAQSFHFGVSDQGGRNGDVGGFRLREQGVASSERQYRAQGSSHDVIGGNVTSDFRITVTRERQQEGASTDRPALVVHGAFTGGPSQVFRLERETAIDVQETISGYVGPHVIRLGGLARRAKLTTLDASNFGGTFEFADLARFGAVEPFVFRISQGDPEVRYTETQASAFLQDELKLRRNLSLTLGARYDWQSTIDAGRGNLAPRVALAYGPGNQRTVFRAGAGLFYELLPNSAVQRRLLLDGTRVREAVVLEPSLVNPLSGGAATSRPPSVTRLAPDLRAPYQLQASAGVERALRLRTFATLEYQHLRGVHLFRSRNINAPPAGTDAPPDPGFGNINQVESSASMRSHALTMTLRGRTRRFFKGMAQYTLSKVQDDTDGIFALPADNYDLGPEWGRSDTDRRHRFNGYATFEFPGSIRLGAVLTLTSGAPFNITTGRDDNHDSVASDRPSGVTRNTSQGPGFGQLDLRATKLFELPRPFAAASRGEMEVNVDVFNALNRTNLTNIVGVVSSPFFGRANEARQARTVQLSVKYMF